MSGVWHSRLDRLIAWGNGEPILTLRRVLWVLGGGAFLFVGYLAAAVAMLMSIVFAPFAIAAGRCALLALDGGITLEPYSPSMALAFDAPIWGNPAHPYTIAGNCVWLVLFGWGLALGHLAAALVQAATIIGIPTALTQLQLAMFALWPFGRYLRRRHLATNLDELLQQLRPGGTDDSADGNPAGGGSRQLSSWV